MLRQFPLMSAAFHALNVAAVFFLARLWNHRYAEEPAIRPRAPQMAADFGGPGLLAMVSAAAIGGVTRADAFGVTLLSQWALGEFLLILGMAAYWLGQAAGASRAGRRASS